MATSVRIEGLDKLRAALGDLAASKALRPILTAAILHLKGLIAVYPPSSEANKPRGFVSKGNNRWYERGFGSKWARKDGSIGSAQTSETLGRSWTEAVDPAGKWAQVGTKASYAPLVQDRDEQAAFHKDRGWLTAQDVLDDNTDDIVGKIADAVSDILAKAG
jgi:hypothetical protein